MLVINTWRQQNEKQNLRHIGSYCYWYRLGFGFGGVVGLMAEKDYIPLADQVGRESQFSKILVRWLPGDLAEMGEAKLLCSLLARAFADRDIVFFNSQRLDEVCAHLGLDASAVRQLYKDGTRATDPKEKARELIRQYENGEGISRERFEAAKQFLAEF